MGIIRDGLEKAMDANKRVNPFVTVSETAVKSTADFWQGERNVTPAEAERRATEDTDGWFPKMDRGAGVVTERALEGRGEVRENFVESAMPGELDREDLGDAVGAWQQQRDQDEIGPLQSAAESELGLFFNLGTGISPKTGERQASGVGEVTAPLWWFGGSVARGLGTAGAGALKLSTKGGKSARASFKNASKYMPETARTVAKAPARTTAAKGVKGATGSTVKASKGVATGVDKFVSAMPMGKTLATVGGVGAATGALGTTLAGPVAADTTQADTVLHVAAEMSDPFCLIFEVRRDEEVAGYAAVLDVKPEQFESEPETATVIVTGGGVGTANESWPPTPRFGSPREARSAYDQLNSQMNDPPDETGGQMNHGPIGQSRGSWKQVSHVRSLDGGWHLYVQPHETEDKSRYIVAGKRRDGRLLYLGSEARADPSFAAFKERAMAIETVDEWLRLLNKGTIQAVARPDPSADRPSAAEIGGTDQTSVLKSRVSNSTLIKVGAALAGLIAGLVWLGGR